MMRALQFGEKTVSSKLTFLHCVLQVDWEQKAVPQSLVSSGAHINHTFSWLVSVNSHINTSNFQVKETYLAENGSLPTYITDLEEGKIYSEG